jgi:putative tryptophan/tyrosine transport system substrate-binding protein
MRRREFITVLGGAAAWPMVARAQQPERMRRIGVLLTGEGNDAATQSWLDGFQRRLRELGWTDERNVRFERRWAGSNPERIRTNVTEIVDIAPDVILAQNTPMVAALRKRTDSIPIVFVQVSDPVGDGFVESLAHPGENVTGFTNTMSSLGGKWVELLREAAPKVARVGYLFNRAAAPGAGAYYMTPLLSAATVLGLNVVSLEAHHEDEIDSVITDFAAAGGDGVVANSDSFMRVHRDRIIATVNRLRLPTIYPSAAFTNSGGLLSYGPDTEQEWQGAASYVDRILRGEKPRDLPVQQPVKFVLTINLKTAKVIGLDVPWFLQQRANEVIE